MFFSVLFQANLIFKDFQYSPVYYSTFQACANHVYINCWFDPGCRERERERVGWPSSSPFSDVTYINSLARHAGIIRDAGAFSIS